MRNTPFRLKKLSLQFAILGMATAACLDCHAKEVSFDQAFNTKGEPIAMHFHAVFIANGVEHRLEVWRDGDRRIKRNTDDVIETYASRKPGEAEFEMTILDKKRRINTVIERANLYRIGNFTDWFDLGHGLRHPKGQYQITMATASESAPKPIQACKWFVLTQDNRDTKICWNAQNRLPLLIQTHDGHIVWRIESLDTSSVPAKTFEVRDEGYIRHDANEDIERD